MSIYDAIRPDILESLERYARCEQVHPFGGFLTAVLSGDPSAIMRADEDNLRAFGPIMAFCANKLPSESWGSPEKHSAWINRGHEAWLAAKAKGVA